MPKILKSLYVQVIIAILIGIALGFFYPAFAVKLKPLGDGFIKLVKMMIAAGGILYHSERYSRHAKHKKGWQGRHQGFDLF